MKSHLSISVCIISLLCMIITGCGKDTDLTSDLSSEQTETIQETHFADNVTNESASTVELTATTQQPTHAHQWEDITSNIHHDAITEKVWVIDSPASVENLTKIIGTCTVCGKTFLYGTAVEGDQYQQMQQHLSSERTLYSNNLANGYQGSVYPEIRENIEYIPKHNAEKGHYENKVTKEAYDETVITGQRCKTCGEYRSVETNKSN